MDPKDEIFQEEILVNKTSADFKFGDYKLQFTLKICICAKASRSEEGILLRQE